MIIMRLSALLLPGLSRFSDVGLAALRVLAGVFLVWGVQDNVLSEARMQEFVRFCAANGFPAPEIMAPLSVYAQLICGSLLIVGLFTRLAAIVMAVHFIVAVLMVHLHQDFRAQWPALVLVFLCAYFAARGAGHWSADRWLAAAARNSQAASP
jgi:putative oxidoreductase